MVQVRRIILSGVALLSAIGVAFGTGITSVSAQASFADNVCIPSGGHPSQCMNDWNGDLTLGASATRFYHYGNSGGHNAIEVVKLGTIDTNGGSQPFTVGSGLNARYNGSSYYQLEWSRNGNGTGVCIAGYSYNADPYNDRCVSSGYSTGYVYTSYSDLVSIGASNTLYANTHTQNQPVWMGSNGKGNIGNGDFVFLTTTQANNLPWGFSSDGG